LLAVFAVGAGLFGSRLPSGFLPEEDQGYVYLALQLPDASSLERTDQAARKIEDILSKIPGVQYTTSVVGFSLLSLVQNTYSAFFFVTFKPWSERTKPEEQYTAIKANINKQLAVLTEGLAIAFPPPTMPAVGASAARGRFISKRKANTAQTRRTSANSSFGTRTAPPFHSTRSQQSRTSPVRNSRCGTTNIARRKSTVLLRPVTARTRRWLRSKK